MIGELARRAHGVVTRSELIGAGLTTADIRGRLERGSLLRVHRGVYRVGHQAPSREATYIAAVKACGHGALLAGRAAANLWGLIRGSPPPPVVLAPTQRRVAGLRVVRARQDRPVHADGERPHGGAPASTPPLHPDASRRLGIPVTTVPRTVVDLASSLPEPALARAFHEANVLYGTTPDQVEEVLGRLPNSRGAGELRKVICGDTRITLSTLERRFLRRLREARLPLPQTNQVAGGRRVDCRWPERNLTVELDGYRYHRTRHAWEQDRHRERDARARGDEFRRYTWEDVSEHPVQMLEDLKALLLR